MIHQDRQKMYARCITVLLLTFTCACLSVSVFAQSSENEEDEKKSAELENNLVQKRAKSPAIVLKERLEAFKPKPVLPTEKVLIKEVNVVGTTILAKAAIRKLKSLYTGKELTGSEMQQIADRINRAYSRHGFITSYAYIVPEKLSTGTLEIVVVEGKTGTITIKGNRYYSADVVKKKLGVKEGELFNFKDVSLGVFRFNKHPDRKASLELDPTQDGKLTNITLTVKDKSPLHATLQADNYGADTILYNRFRVYLTTNNLTGHDDSLTYKTEWSQGDAHKIFDLDYNIPINNKWKFELYMMPFKVEDYYYKDNKDTDFEKRARKWYIWFYQELIEQPDCELVSSYGYTYMDIFWYKPYLKYDVRTRMDRFRVFKWDLSLNKADKYGRWVITNDLQMAAPNMWGGDNPKTDETSVVGAGGNYQKNLLTVARRQKLFAGIDFITKARWQLSSQTLTGVNTFDVGGTSGVIDNRGFPRTQVHGDGGRAVNTGFDFPPYFIPKNIKVPYSQTKLYNALKLFTFYDWGQAVLKSPKMATTRSDPNDKKITTLGSAGCGFTFNLPDRNLAIRVDCGWPLTHQAPEDGDHFHMFWSVTQGF